MRERVATRRLLLLFVERRARVFATAVEADREIEGLVVRRLEVNRIRAGAAEIDRRRRLGLDPLRATITRDGQLGVFQIERTRPDVEREDLESCGGIRGADRVLRFVGVFLGRRGAARSTRDDETQEPDPTQRDRSYYVGLGMHRTYRRLTW